MFRLIIGAVAGGILVVGLPQTSSMAQSSGGSLLTCRAVLEGADFAGVETGEATGCCFVSEENDWYATNGIRLNHLYRRGDLTTRTERCEAALSGAATRNGTDSRTTGSAAGQTAVQAAAPDGGAQSGTSAAAQAAAAPSDPGQQAGGTSVTPEAAASNSTAGDDAKGNGNGGSHANNGFGNGGNDGSRNGKQDETR